MQVVVSVPCSFCCIHKMYLDPKTLYSNCLCKYISNIIKTPNKKEIPVTKNPKPVESRSRSWPKQQR